MMKPTLPLAYDEIETRLSGQQVLGHQGEVVHPQLLVASCICLAGIGTPEYLLPQILGPPLQPGSLDIGVPTNAL